MAVVRTMRRLCQGFSALSALGITLTVLLVSLKTKGAAIVCGAVSVAALILLYRQSRLLSAAQLIYDNRILTIPSSIVTAGNQEGTRMMEETVVSTFGMLLGNKLYRWGCEGMHGTRLQDIRIDREQIRVTFGKDDESLRLELLHGMTKKEEVLMIAQKLRYETGVQAEVCDW
ncbi:MAG TPA: hypothetical protein PKN71_06775 [Bacillota bacterium]|jgi:hypothetical protein|nr:hypothetical protein [Bacillota bacterium]HOC07001.1 hypothetical protein [Bacillota bacterium]HPZ22554.1 hypothetical protein [Bacillota bacterium]HQD20410.1 hypothetical protein [Bacillota bacterium]